MVFAVVELLDNSDMSFRAKCSIRTRFCAELFKDMWGGGTIDGARFPQFNLLPSYSRDIHCTHFIMHF